MTTKICNNCGARVDESVNFCPNCKSQSFRPYGEIVTQDNGPVHKLFYWQYDEGYVLSKSKVLSAATLVFMTIGAFFAPYAGGVIFFGLIAAVIIYAGGYVLHQIRGKPSQIVLKYNDYGFLTDLKNVLFYWQNKKTGEYVLSKTKIITLAIVVVAGIAAVSLAAPNALAVFLLMVILGIPTFAVGFAIHKLTNPNPTNPEGHKQVEPKRSMPKSEPKKSIGSKIKDRVTPQETIIPEFVKYKNEILDLKLKFNDKDKKARKLIEKRFEPPQLTYTRFIGLVDKSAEVFTHQCESALNMIDLAGEYTPRMESEIVSKIDILKSINQKLDDLSNELILSMDEAQEDDIDGLVEDMEGLIGSVKDYS